ncbi:hypothetical protein HYALB_00007206 [Hymenoscyphus albidus]|uniref:Gag1-like clamp domain-containing protein n=1 Tax=Hymenoscyphus albidus TaxID=595503 RepID=A0A9N9LFM7_9HELO|nr:hypothetical protein HYALB_00007206 [Hymenoscyphus albidus]
MSATHAEDDAPISSTTTSRTGTAGSLVADPIHHQRGETPPPSPSRAKVNASVKTCSAATVAAEPEIMATAISSLPRSPLTSLPTLKPVEEGDAVPLAAAPAAKASPHTTASHPLQNQHHELHQQCAGLGLEATEATEATGKGSKGGEANHSVTAPENHSATEHQSQDKDKDKQGHGSFVASHEMTMRVKGEAAHSTVTLTSNPHQADITPLSPKTADPTSDNKAPIPPTGHPSGRQQPPPLSNIFHFHHGSGDNPQTPAPHPHMFFKTSHGPGTAAHRRKSLANTTAITNYEADLTSRDRVKLKEAVKKYLVEKVKDDWKWEWPRPEETSSPDNTRVLELDGATEETPNEDLEPTESIEQQWQERDEWISNASESEPEPASKVLNGITSNPRTSPFRFENPDVVGETVQNALRDRKRRRKRRNKEEMNWNDGVRCFTERRDAWTGARRKRAAPQNTAQQKRTSVSTEDGGSSTAIENEADDEWEDSDTEVPIAPPILPPTNAMRQSITPEAYNTIYDKVILQQLTPSCPMNLQDVIRSCVHGWKRDNEWPPKAAGGPIQVPKPKKKLRKLSVAGIFGLDKDKDGNKDQPTSPGGIRRGLQRLMSFGKDSVSSPTSPGLNGHVANGNGNGNLHADGQVGNGHVEVEGEEVAKPTPPPP